MQPLETERLILREFVKSDWKAVHEYASDLEVVQYLEWGPNTADESLSFLEGTLACQKEKPRRIFEFAITLKENGKLIGACGIRLHDQNHEQADLGYCFNRQYWGKGYASEASKAVVDFAFKTLGLHRIVATCDTSNLASAAVLRKTGLRQEGHFIQERKVREVWRDTLQFAVLRSEYQGRSSDKRQSANQCSKDR
jgi:[ribosomal protein S5]-alanine N-acetyltransferase